MVLAMWGMLLIVPSAVVGFLLARRASRLLIFLTMFLVFGLTVFAAWSSLRPLVNSSEGILALVAHTLVAILISGGHLPSLSRRPASN